MYLLHTVTRQINRSYFIANIFFQSAASASSLFHSMVYIQSEIWQVEPGVFIFLLFPVAGVRFY